MSSPTEESFRDSLRPSDIKELKRLADEAMEPDAVAGERVLWTQILSVTSAMRSSHQDHVLPEASPTDTSPGLLGPTPAPTSRGYKRCRLAVHRVSRDGSHTAKWLTQGDDDGRAFIHVDVPAFQWWRAVITATEAPE